MSLRSKEIIPIKDGYFNIQPHDTVLILTNEAIWVSNKIAGTFHSKVGVVSQGFGHISTTLDPNWQGPLLISLNNPTDLELKLPAQKSFVTLIFYRVNTPALKEHDNNPSRVDILRGISEEVIDQKLTENGKIFVKKVQGLLERPNVYAEFTKRYNEITQQSRPSILSGIKNYINHNKRHNLKYKALEILQILLLLGIITRLVLSVSLFDQYELIQNLIKLIDKSAIWSMIAIMISIFTAKKAIKE